MAKRPLPDLPDEVRALIAPHLEPDTEKLDEIGVVIAGKRDEAKKARAASGIELVWKACEEAYVGIDDANRHEFGQQRWAKPMSSDGPVNTDRPQPNPDHKSTAYVRLTARYVDAGAAKLGEILLPLDDKAFEFTETPVPELIQGKDDDREVLLDHMGGAPAMRPARPGENPTGPQPVPAQPGAPPVAVAAPAAGAVQPAGAGGPPMVPIQVKDLAQENIEAARKKAKAAEKRIYDWMVECQHTAETRKVIFDSARIGVGVLKGPYAKPARNIVVKGEADGIEVRLRETVKPADKWVDPWNIFPDPACGENIHNGDFLFERDHLSERQVRDLKRTPGYIAAQIDKVLKEGPDKINLANNGESATKTEVEQQKGRYEIWYFTGTLSRDDMECICQAGGKTLTGADVPADRKEVFAIVTMINDCVIRATINPLDSGSFNYHSMPWQRRPGHWAGIGVAEQIVTPQRMVNAATRAMLNNAGKSSGSQIVIDRAAITPADGSWAVTPDKVWNWTGEEGITRDVRAAFAAFEIPNTTPQLMSIITYALRLAEESTSIPLITQGQSGPTQPETLGGMQLQNNNANQLLRSIGYTFDDFITEPLVRQYYEWLLLDPEVPEEEKGDYNINAHGSGALIERAIQDQTLAQMGVMVLNPAYKMDPAKWAAEFVKSKRLDPRAFQRPEEEQAKIDALPPPEAPPIAAAKIQADARLKAAEIVAETDKDKALAQGRIDLEELRLRERIAMLENATKRGISVDQVKAELAGLAMKLDTQKELSAADRSQPQPTPSRKRVRRQRGGPQITMPPTEPAGRAPNGRAFQA